MTEVQILASTKQGRIWTAVAVVFLCGLLVGIVATKAYDDYQQQQKWETGLAGLKPRLMKHLTRELHLNAEQQVVWNGLQKIMFNTWQNNGRRQADDAWWTGKPDNAAKAKAAKGKVVPKAPAAVP